MPRGIRQLVPCVRRKTRLLDSANPASAETFAALVRELESNPVTTSVTAEGSAANEGGDRRRGAGEWLVDMSFATQDYPHVPSLDRSSPTGTRESRPVYRKAVLATPKGIGYGLTYGVICGEWVPYRSESDVLLQGRLAFPDYPDSVLAPAVHFTNLCRLPPLERPQGSPAQRSVTRSNIPTLILSGGSTPSHRRVGKNRGPNASHSRDVVLPGSDISLPPCLDAARVIASFLAKPDAPDASCVGVATAQLSPGVLDE